MEIFAAVLGVIAAGLGVTVGVLGLRIGGLKSKAANAVNDALDADTKRQAAEAALKVNTTAFDDYRRRAEFAKGQLIKELERYEQEKLDAIEAEPNRPARIAMRRDWVRSVLSQASEEADAGGDDGQDRLHNGEAPDSESI